MGCNFLPGSDVPFSAKEVQHGNSFVKKMYNAFRFVEIHLKDTKDRHPAQLSPIDKGILYKLAGLIESTKKNLDNYEFGNAFDPLRVFFWHDICDNYLEMIKHVFYEGTEEEKESVRYTLRTLMFSCLKMLAPFIPHITEELYREHYPESIHKQKWPTPVPEGTENDANVYELSKEVIANVRAQKTAKKMALNSEFEELTIRTIFAEDLKKALSSIRGTTKAKKVTIAKGENRADVEVKW